jgi:hypothetical protein
VNFISKLNYVSVAELIEMLDKENRPKGFFSYPLVYEIKPIDLYCYFYAKFGQPNGLQNFLRNNSSDNLVHWEWTFLFDENLISFQSLNVRTEIIFIGNFEAIPDPNKVIEDIKKDFQNYGKAIKEVREKLEKWKRFVNPFNRLHVTVKQTIRNIEKLNLDIENDRSKISLLGIDGDSQDTINDLLNRYNNAVCYYFSLKSMLPVMAESFVNLVIYILAKKEIKINERLFQNVIRQPIDIRVQSLHINCDGFKSMVDYSNDSCKRFHSIINERNDILHGNVDMKSLGIGDIYFNGNVPIFTEYDDLYSRTSGAYLKSIKYDSILQNYDDVNGFIGFILDSLDSNTRTCIEQLAFRREIGVSYRDGRLGALLPDDMIDFRMPQQAEL